MMRTSVSVIGTQCYFVIPGWSEGPDSESRDSGFDAYASRRNDGVLHSELAQLRPASSDEFDILARIARRGALCSIARAGAPLPEFRRLAGSFENALPECS